MAKRGRKPSTEKKTGYFEEREEKAFVRYIKEQDKHEKEKIFNTFLMEPFTKMTESIIRRYNLYVPDEDFNETFNDAMSFLMTKINNFNPETSFKAYSYTGTIIKNYLMGKINSYVKKQKEIEASISKEKPKETMLIVPRMEKERKREIYNIEEW